MAGELATVEELAAREARRLAERPDQTPAEALFGSHDVVSDDDLATAIAAHPDRGILLALWQRITGRGEVADDHMAEDEPEPEPEHTTPGVT